MILTTDQICDKQFRNVGGNYDPDDVDEFLDQICDTIDELNARIKSLEADVAKANAEAEEARSSASAAARQSSANDIGKQTEALSLLSTAQRVVDEMQAEAQKKADSVVAEAQQKAEEIINNARSEHGQLSGELESLRKAKGNLRTEMLEMLDTYRSLILDTDTEA